MAKMGFPLKKSVDFGLEDEEPKKFKDAVLEAVLDE